MASSSIRQPEDVLVSVASPLAPGASSVGCEGGVEALAGGARTEHGHPDGDRQRSGRSGADQDETTRRPHAARTSLRLDARPQRRRRLDLVRGAPRERDRPLLLGEPVGELRRRRDSRLERGTTLRRERPVRERRQLGDLLTAGLVFSTTSHRHGKRKVTPSGLWRRAAPSGRPALGEYGASRGQASSPLLRQIERAAASGGRIHVNSAENLTL